MKIPLLLFTLLSASLPCLGQISDPGDENPPPAQPRYPVALPVNPGAAQDAEAAREKLLKASDELDMIQTNSEATKSAVDGMKTDMAKLQADNAALKQQVADLQSALNKTQEALERDEQNRTKEKAVLLDEVASLIEASKSAGHPTARRHAPPEVSPEDEASSSTEVHAHGGEAAHEGAASSDAGDASSAGDDSGKGESLSPPADPTQPKRQGYYHVVERGETLTMICAAFRDQGVKVSTAQVRKANGLSEKSVLKVGQKLFIPKPGT